MGCLKLTYEEDFLEGVHLNVWKNSNKIVCAEPEKKGFRCDHLGNIKAVITDRRRATITNGIVTEAYPEVVHLSDYYAFGMLMGGKTYSSGNDYLYGFNGAEKDDEVAGKGNSYSAQYWQYDGRIGRSWNRDPKPNSSISEYVCFANNWNNYKKWDEFS